MLLNLLSYMQQSKLTLLFENLQPLEDPEPSFGRPSCMDIIIDRQSCSGSGVEDKNLEPRMLTPRDSTCYRQAPGATAFPHLARQISVFEACKEDSPFGDGDKYQELPQLTSKEGPNFRNAASKQSVNTNTERASSEPKEGPEANTSLSLSRQYYAKAAGNEPWLFGLVYEARGEPRAVSDWRMTERTRSELHRDSIMEVEDQAEEEKQKNKFDRVEEEEKEEEAE
ncbi:unnamed protein product [Schistocephalus solidus]|uniref:Uncharacterized protein n=1 Tax=Schistocephalus solidus TaxID=70667 RepID=A0A183TEF3_SCHSO|nr:unnamed protein product [Schistocephalus solidus]